MLMRVFGHRKEAPGSARSQDAGQTKPAPPLPLEDFVASLVEDGHTDDMCSKTLWHLYGEFCLWTETEQLTKGQFNRRKGKAGIERYREPVGARRWLYRVHARSESKSEQLKDVCRLRVEVAVRHVGGLRKA
jgi:hypothetical protein